MLADPQPATGWLPVVVSGCVSGPLSAGCLTCGGDLDGRGGGRAGAGGIAGGEQPATESGPGGVVTPSEAPHERSPVA
jgi:hypothetical protein